MASESKASPLYFVVQNGEVRGPYDLAFIEAMVMSSLLPRDPQVQKEGSDTWRSLSSILPPTLPSQSPPKAQVPSQRNEQPTPKKPNKFLSQLGGCLIQGSGLFLFILASAALKSCHDSTPAYRTVYTIKGENGQDYIVSEANYRMLEAKQSQLETWSRNIEINRSNRQAEGRRIETQRLIIDNTDQVEVDAFNIEVRKYNESGDQLQAAIDSYNIAVETFNIELARVGTPKK